MTTALPVHIRSAVPNKDISDIKLDIDIQKNEPRIMKNEKALSLACIFTSPHIHTLTHYHLYLLL